jgi:Flp pilus assembly protein TadD
MESNRQEDAIRLLNEVLRADFRCVEAHLLAAAAHEKLGRLAEAADHLALLMAVEPDHVEANRRLAAILGRLGDTRGFVRCLRKIVAITNAQDVEALSMLGIGLSEDGQHFEAIEILQRVADACPQLGSAQADLGMALLNAGQFDKASAALTRALALDPTSAQAYCGLGLCYRRAGRWREAAEAFMSTEQLAPHRAIGPFNLALVLEALGDGHGARQALFRAAALDPNDEEIERALERFLPRPGPDEVGPRRPITSVTSAFDASIRGDLRMFPLLDVLEFLRLQAKTGTLAVTSRRGVGAGRGGDHRAAAP